MRLVPARGVQRFYAECELRKPEYRGPEWPAPDQVASLDGDALASLVHRLAVFRNNEAYHTLVETPYRWLDTTVASSDLLVLGINPGVASALSKAQGRVGELARIYLEDPGPEGGALRKEFKPFSGSAASGKMICVRCSRSSARIVDGAHRAVGLAIMGRSELDCYLGELQPLQHDP